MKAQKGISTPIMLIVIGIIAVAGALSYFFLADRDTGQPIVENNGSANGAQSSSNNNSQDAKDTSDESSYIHIYMVDLEDSRGTGQKIGCDDSMISINTNRLKTGDIEADIKIALGELFSITDRDFGKGGLYNSLYQSRLKVDKTQVTGEVLQVYVSGTVLKGGICDDPRFSEQILQTAKQFSTTQQVDVYLNNELLK